MTAAPADIARTLRELRRTPRVFASVAADLTEAQLRRRPASDSWSVHELLAHLRGAADVQGAWVARMLAEDVPSIRYASARTGMAKTGYDGHDFATFLRDFRRQRAALVTTLATLDPAAWDRSATFTGTTPGWQPTVLAIASGLARHEHAHEAQIRAAADAVR